MKQNPFKKAIFWLNCARLYTAPITIFSWAVAFLYSLKHGGNPIWGIVCLFGILPVHLATNLIDDYFDYKVLENNEKFMNSVKGFKCKYLKDGFVNRKDLRNAILAFLGFASFIGLILLFASGWHVITLALIALLIAVTYPRLSSKGFGEIAIIIAYGPLMFEGIYYVMTKNFSFEIFILSIICACYTNSILYTHMLMDFDSDMHAHKTTLCLKLKTKENALRFLLAFYGTGFIGLLYLAQNNILYLLGFITLPMILDLYGLLAKYNENKSHLPKIRFWHKPLDNWENIKDTNDAPFYLRFLYSRNILVIFMLILCIAIIFG